MMNFYEVYDQEKFLGIYKLEEVTKITKSNPDYVKSAEMYGYKLHNRFTVKISSLNSREYEKFLKKAHEKEERKKEIIAKVTKRISSAGRTFICPTREVYEKLRF